jgi:hypothetical protein
LFEELVGADLSARLIEVRLVKGGTGYGWLIEKASAVSVCMQELANLMV